MSARLPRSLLAPKHAAPLVTLAAAALVVVELGLSRTDPWPFLVAIDGSLALSAALVVGLAARPGHRRFIVLVLAGATVVLTVPLSFVGMAVGPGNPLVAGAEMALAMLTGALISCVPILAAALVYGPRAARGDCGAGDATLAVGAVWLAAGQLVFTAVPARRMLAVGAIAAAALVVAVTIGRAVRRRRWCERVARGELPGLRMRSIAPHDAPERLEALPVVLGPRAAARALFEEVGPEGDAYRAGAGAAVPIALAPATYLRNAR